MFVPKLILQFWLKVDNERQETSLKANHIGLQIKMVELHVQALDCL